MTRKVFGPIMILFCILVGGMGPHGGRYLLMDIWMTLCTIYWIIFTKEAYGPRNAH